MQELLQHAGSADRLFKKQADWISRLGFGNEKFAFTYIFLWIENEEFQKFASNKIERFK